MSHPTHRAPWLALKPFFSYLKLDMVFLCNCRQELTHLGSISARIFFIFIFIFYFKDRKVVLAAEQTTFLFPLNPGCPLSMTLCQPADACLLLRYFPKLRWLYILLPPLLLSGGEDSSGWAASDSLECWGIQFSSLCWLAVLYAFCLCMCPAEFNSGRQMAPEGTWRVGEHLPCPGVWG